MKLIQLTLLTSSIFFASGTMASPFILQSDEFINGGKLSVSAGGGGEKCPGNNLSPSLKWQNPPANTKSYVLVIDDPQGANGLGINHLIAYGIDAKRNGFSQGELTAGENFIPGTNSKDIQGYFGPCPPATAGIHNYNFTLIATDLKANSLKPGLKRDDVFKELKGHALASSGLVAAFILEK